MPKAACPIRSTTRRTVGSTVALLAVVLLLAATRAGADSRVVNGVTTSGHPTVGVLLNSANFGSADLLCSGTLIGCRTFLTAAHCVEGDLNPNHYGVFLQNAGFFAVSAIQSHPSYSFPDGDVAVLTLSTSVVGIAPSKLNTSMQPPIGTTATIVGYGRTGGVAEDYGVKRDGDTTTTACSDPISETNSVCWLFDNPLGPPGSNSNTCNGDSGGPLFADLGSGPVQIGITSGGGSLDCYPIDESYDANVFTYSAWIAGAAGADINNTTCGPVIQVGSPGTSVSAITGSLDQIMSTATHSFPVTAGKTTLRVTMNGASDPGHNDFDLYVKHGSPPTTGDFDCKDEGGGQFASCTFANPAAGDWYVLVNGWSVAPSGGLFQLTATAFAPADDGTPCDDENPCTEMDEVQAGICTGTDVADSTPCSSGSACTAAGACMSGVCVPGANLPDLTPCPSPSYCSAGGLCLAGACEPGPPPTGCKLPILPGRGSLVVKNNAADNVKDKLIWKWSAGEQTDLAEFGDPATGGTIFAVCVHDETAGAPQLVLERVIQPGLWRPTGSGFKYRDRTHASDGIGSVVLRSGADGKSKIIVRGKTAQLDLPAMPFQQDSKLTVRLVKDDGTCWQSDYSTEISNTGTLFKAKSD